MKEDDGVRLVGIGETLKRIVGNCVIKTHGTELQMAAGTLLGSGMAEKWTFEYLLDINVILSGKIPGMSSSRKKSLETNRGPAILVQYCG